jgi:hypothetical protein
MMTKCWPSRVDLSEDDPEASWLFVVLKAGIHDEGIQAVTVRINYNRFWAEVGLEFQKCLQGI